MKSIYGMTMEKLEEYFLSLGEKHHPDICWKNGADLEKEELMNAEGVLDFQEYIKKELKVLTKLQILKRL